MGTHTSVLRSDPVSDRNMRYPGLITTVLVYWPSFCVIAQDGQVKVNFCCPDGETLRVKSFKTKLKAVCTRKRNLKNNFEGMEVSVIDMMGNETEYVKRNLNKLNSKKPACSRGLMIGTLDLQEPTGTHHISRKIKISRLAARWLCCAVVPVRQAAAPWRGDQQ